MKKICIFGSFAKGEKSLNGQTVKTLALKNELEKIYGLSQINLVDLENAKKELLQYPFIVWRALKGSENIIILPAHNGIRIIAPLLVIENVFMRRRLHYVVVGGWLPSFLKKKKFLRRVLQKFTCIYVETSTMKNALKNKGFDNVIVFPNFKQLPVLSKKEIRINYSAPYKLCTFSRVMQKKGIDDAINAVEEINSELGIRAYELDIYGMIEKGEEEWFANVKKKMSDAIKYKGCVDSNESVDILRNYFALLFPTRFYTEGIPGTIIDAYSAAVPVISSKWENFSDVVDDGKTGIGYEFGDYTKLKNVLRSVFMEPDLIIQKKSFCVEKATHYSPESLINILTEQL